MPIGILKLVPALSDLLTASMLANSLGFVPLTVSWSMPAGNADRLAEFLPQLVERARELTYLVARFGL